MRRLPHPARSRAALAAGTGAAWGATLFATLGWRVPPGPETAAQWAVLAALCLALAATHAGLVGLLFALAARLARGARPAAADLVAALALGALYGTLALSLVKFVGTHAHLRAQDLWFVFRSLPQVAGEGTAAERGWLVSVLLLPSALTALFFAVARRDAAGGGRPPSARRAAAMALAGATALAALAAAVAPARWALATLVPEGAFVARHVDGRLAAAPPWRPDPALQARLAPAAAAPPAERWSVVVVMLESVPWKRLYGPERRAGSTPALDRLAAESIVFERAYAASTHSDYAQTSILASLAPRKGPAHDYFTAIDYPRALPWDLLAPHGWRSAIFSTQNERWGNMIAFLRTPALATLRHAPDFPGAPRRGDGAETKLFEPTVVAAFLDWVGEERERPFVAYLNFQATHYPYVWPAGFAPPYGEAPIDFPTTFLAYPRERIPRMLDRFHNALAAVDAATGALVEGLQARGVWDRTALVVVADHGEAFYEHGLPTHGTTLHEEQVRVPLLLRLPGAAPRVVAEPVSVLDALPTLYRAMGLPRHGALQGRDDLLDPGYSGRRRPLTFTIQGMTHEDGALFGDWKWIANRDRGDGALFHLASDPDERRNLARAEPERRRALETLLAAQLERQLGYYRARGWESGWYPPRLP